MCWFCRREEVNEEASKVRKAVSNGQLRGRYKMAVDGRERRLNYLMFAFSPFCVLIRIGAQESKFLGMIIVKIRLS